jgi:hypothetical protein
LSSRVAFGASSALRFAFAFAVRGACSFAAGVVVGSTDGFAGAGFVVGGRAAVGLAACDFGVPGFALLDGMLLEDVLLGFGRVALRAEGLPGGGTLGRYIV